MEVNNFETLLVGVLWDVTYIVQFEYKYMLILLIYCRFLL